MVGTLPYMSPEQLGIDEIDHRTDLWALGIMLFEMLAGRHPLEPLTVEALIATATSPRPMPSIARRACRTCPSGSRRSSIAACASARTSASRARASSSRRLEPLLPGRARPPARRWREPVSRASPRSRKPTPIASSAARATSRAWSRAFASGRSSASSGRRASASRRSCAPASCPRSRLGRALGRRHAAPGPPAARGARRASCGSRRRDRRPTSRAIDEHRS